MTEFPALPKKRRGFSLDRTIDPIAVAALVLSILGVGWQIWNAFVGAELDQLEYSDRIVEFRCNSFNITTCWNGSGHLAIILPVFFSNTGAAGYADAVSRVDLSLTIDGASIDMLANDFWLMTQNGGQGSRPFRPIVVNGREAGGQELRFIGVDPTTRPEWTDFAELVISGKVKSLTLSTTSHFAISDGAITKTCIVNFSDRLVDVLNGRRDSYPAWAAEQKKKKEDRKRVRKPGVHLTTRCA